MKNPTKLLIISAVVVVFAVLGVKYFTGGQNSLGIPNFLPRQAISPELSQSSAKQVNRTISVSIDFGNGKKVSNEVIAGDAMETPRTVSYSWNKTARCRIYNCYKRTRQFL